MSCNANTLLHEEHAYLSVVAAALTKLATDKTDSPLKRVEEMVRTTMVLVRGSELDGKVTAARLLELWALATPSILASSVEGVGNLHRQITSELVACVLELSADKPRTFNIRARTWADLLTASARTTVLRDVQEGVGGKTSADQSPTTGKPDTAGTRAVVDHGEASQAGKTQRRRLIATRRYYQCTPPPPPPAPFSLHHPAQSSG